jgi:ectonucleotide pyrophosphatase/phosphodiesterase family protein 1/3
MYDVNLNESFYLGSATSTKPHWWSGEPIWNTVVKHNKYAMTYFWPGSDVEINGMRPTDYRNYSSSHPYSLRVDTALQWLNGSVNGLTPDLVVLYFSKVDEAGHEGGPHSLEVNEALETVDDAILQLMDGLYRLHLHTCVNIMIVSDHGMSDMSCDRSILVGNYLSGEVMNKTYMYTGSAGRISNKYYADSKYNYYELAPDQQVSIANITNTLSCVTPYMAVYDKQYLPRQFHYINNIRIDDVQLIVVDTYMTEKTEPWCPIRGYHGWDARYDSMKALFIGYGPTFRQRSAVPSFENIELYNLMAYLVNVTSAANNGTAGRLNNLLHTPPPELDDSILAVPYQHVQFPGDSLEYELRINATVTGCPCSLTNNGSLLLSYDDRLNTTESDWNMLQLRHVPHGLPLYVNTSTASPSQYLLHHGDFVSAYSNEMLMPLWTAANITASSKTNFPEASVNCSRVDVRLNANQAQPTCNSYLSKANLLPTYLFPPHWSQDFDSSTEAQLLTNVVPMSSHFQTVVWQFMLQYIQNVTVKYPGEQIYVVMGPVFDYDADGLKDTNLTLARLAVAGGSDIPVPSHYFVLLLKCLNVTSCIQQDYDALSFIVPQWQTPGSSNCLNTVQFLHMNAARIRDIELLTGLQFLSESASQRAVQIRTVVAEKLW